MSNKVSIYSEPRFIETVEIINTVTNDSSLVVEVGSSDASFKDFSRSRKWITIDKYGKPDINVDLNGTDIELPFSSRSIDVVICTEVLEHLTLGSPLVKELARILKPTGHAVISVPNIVSLKARLSMLAGRLPGLAASGDCGPNLGGTGVFIDGHWVGAHVVDFNSARLYKYLSRSGFIIEKHWPMPMYINKPIRLRISGKMFPKNLLDYIIVTARPGNLERL